MVGSDRYRFGLIYSGTPFFSLTHFHFPLSICCDLSVIRVKWLEPRHRSEVDVVPIDGIERLVKVFELFLRFPSIWAALFHDCADGNLRGIGCDGQMKTGVSVAQHRGVGECRLDRVE